MKCIHLPLTSGLKPSLPVRGAWVEIVPLSVLRLDRQSLPVRGAWVEMGTSRQGLSAQTVAPRAGSVG